MKGRKSGGRWGWVSMSVLLHAALVAALVGVWWWSAPAPVEQSLGIEARVVTPGGTPPVPPEPAPQPAPPEPEPAPSPSPDEVAAEKAKQQADAEAARASEERRLAEQREAAELQAKQEADRQARDKAAKEQAAKEQAEKDRLEKEKAEREKAAKEKLDREQQQKLQAERARAAREAELNAMLEADKRQATTRDSTQMRQYIALIANKIERNWLLPGNAKSGLECEVQVTQVPGGEVTDVKIGRCNGDDSVRQSLEAAVYRASPLPQPSDPALFERSLVVTFRPE